MTRILDTIAEDLRPSRPRHPEKAHRPDQPVARKPDWIRVKAPGSPVYSLGNPGGHERVFGAGVITAVRQRRGVTVLQTTAPMSPGSSGGGLFDAHGNLVGSTSFRLIAAGGQSGGYAIAAEEFWR